MSKSKLCIIKEYLKRKPDAEIVYIRKTVDPHYLQIFDLYVASVNTKRDTNNNIISLPVFTITGLESFMDSLVPHGSKPLSINGPSDMGVLLTYGSIYFEEELNYDYVLDHQLMTSRELDKALRNGKPPKRLIRLYAFPHKQIALEVLNNKLDPIKQDDYYIKRKPLIDFVKGVQGSKSKRG